LEAHRLAAEENGGGSGVYLREMIRWSMRKLRVEEWLVSAVLSMYTGAKTVVRIVYGNSNGFEVKVSMH